MRRLFQAAVEIIKRKSPKATFSDFQGCGSFHRPLLSFFFASFFFLCVHYSKVVEKMSRQDHLWATIADSIDGYPGAFFRCPSQDSIFQIGFKLHR